MVSALFDMQKQEYNEIKEYSPLYEDIYSYASGKPKISKTCYREKPNTLFSFFLDEKKVDGVFQKIKVISHEKEEDVVIFRFSCSHLYKKNESDKIDQLIFIRDRNTQI